MIQSPYRVQRKRTRKKQVGAGTWQKCNVSAGSGDGPDIRQWWPACRLYEEISQ